MGVKDFAQSVGQVFKKHKHADHGAKLCTAMDCLSDALHSENVECPMEEFDQSNCDNQTFMFWSAYMSIVEILLDSIRAETDENWILHLE